MRDVCLARLYINKAQSAADLGHEFSISFSEYKRLMCRKTCTYSGLRFRNKGFSSRSLDRIDNSKGYISGNVAAVCVGINSIKSQWENPIVDIDEVSMMKVLISLKKIRNKKGES